MKGEGVFSKAAVESCPGRPSIESRDDETCGNRGRLESTSERADGKNFVSVKAQDIALGDGSWELDIEHTSVTFLEQGINEKVHIQDHSNTRGWASPLNSREGLD